VEHKATIVGTDEANEFRLYVRRRHLFDDSIKGMTRFTDPSKPFRVVFVGEPCVDEGGPRREFFNLFLSELSKHGGLLTGSPGKRMLLHNVIALQKGVFVAIGKLIALSLIHGGPGPQFFTSCTAKYLLGLNVTKEDLCVEDIADSSIVTLVKKVSVHYYDFF
jgi:hypothetical protein